MRRGTSLHLSSNRVVVIAGKCFEGEVGPYHWWVHSLLLACEILHHQLLRNPLA